MSNTTIPPATSGRGWGYAGALLGGLVSIAANVAHSYVPPAEAAVDWRPPLGDVVGAVFWPVALFVAIEILARTTWPSGKRWVVVRFAGLLPVAVVAAIVSYGHLSGLLAHYGESHLTAHLGPLAVDGLMVMASAAVMATAPGRIPVTDTAPESTTLTDTRPDSSADTTLDTKPARVRTPRRTSPGKSGRTGTAAKVAALAAAHPAITTVEMAKRLKVSDRTIRRHLATLGGPDDTTSAAPDPVTGPSSPHLAPATA